MGNEENKQKSSKTKKIIGILAIVAFIGLAIGYSALSKVNENHKINSEAEFIKCFKDGFSNKVGLWDVSSYSIEKDIIITKNNIKNPSMDSYDKKINSGDSTEIEARKVSSYEYTMVIDGKGHTIKNLTLSGYTASLFGNVSGNVTVKNLTFDNLTINGIGPTGALVSSLYENSKARFENVKIINSNITCNEDSPVGGLVGSSNQSRLHIKDCSIENSTIVASSATNVGGIAGYVLNAVQENSTINNCENKSTTIKGLKHVGGIVGEYKDTYVDTLGIYGDEVDEEIIEFNNLESSGTIEAIENKTGGIIGNLSFCDDLNIKFVNCKTSTSTDGSFLTDISGVNDVGGILGSANSNLSALTVSTGSQISFNNCENKQMIQGNNNVGGIVGFIDDKFWDVKFIDCYNNENIFANSNIGGIAGNIEGSILGGHQFSFTNCQNLGSIVGSKEGQYIGGILGYNNKLNPLFTNCKNLGENDEWISGRMYIGGISARYGTFVDCQNTMDIRWSNYANDFQNIWQYVGGIVGSGEGSTFTNCSNSGTIIDHTQGINVSAKYIGGIAGYTDQLVMDNCTNSGTVSGSDCVGGLVGKSDATWAVSPKNTLINCTNTGDVYAFGQETTTLENYTNDDVDDVSGKIGLIIGSFGTGTLIFEFTNVTVKGNIYILDDTDYVGGWCGYMSEGSVLTLKDATKDSLVDYNIYINDGSVSEVCVSNFKYGENVFEDSISGFNKESSLQAFNYTA